VSAEWCAGPAIVADLFASCCLRVCEGPGSIVPSTPAYERLRREDSDPRYITHAEDVKLRAFTTKVIH